MVVLNLLGIKEYQPSHPYVYKIRVDKRLANDLFFCIYDGRPTAFSGKEGWRALRAIGDMLRFLGIQEANRKRTMSSITPGEWAGTSTDSSNDSTTGLVSDKKWKKGQKIICRIQKEQKERGDLDHKVLERDRGFLIYLSRTYRMMAPYLKGVHQTLDS